MQKTLSAKQVLDLYPPHRDTIPSLLASRAERSPDRPVLLFEGRTWTYAQFQTASDDLAVALSAQGVAKGDRVASVSANSDVILLLFIAVAKIGAVFVPVNPDLTDEELQYVLGHCKPRAICCRGADHGRIAAIMAGYGRSAILLALEEMGSTLRTVPEVMTQLARLADDGTSRSWDKPGPKDPVVVIYTSGTTGFPKGVVHSHMNYVWAAEAFVERMHLQPDDRLMTVLPFFHINALFYSFGGALAAGAGLVATSRFSASTMWKLAAETGATQLNILAAVGNILAKRSRAEFVSDHKITKIYGGPISAEMFRVFQQEFHVPTLIEGYGMSEIPGACNNPFEGPHKVGSIGKPARHPRFGDAFVEMQVVDDDGKSLPVGEVGELLVKTPIVTIGYLDDPDQTSAAIQDGWFHTGDLVRRDADGYFFFVARKRDIIRRRGENISGAELDRVLSEHPKVMEAATIGVPAELGDEEIMAVLTARSDPPPSPQEIIDWCSGRLAAMKCPRYIVFVDTLPHTSSHRVAKFRLKQDSSLLAKAFDRERNAV